MMEDGGGYQYLIKRKGQHVASYCRLDILGSQKLVWNPDHWMKK